MKIIRLAAENIKRLKAVEITPDGSLVVVGGKNDAGKSSLLDAIEMALGGEAHTPGEPVRRGEQQGRVVLDLGDIVVTRTFGPGGARKLVVANGQGARFPSPQALLDKLYGTLSFDPLAFERQDRKAQAETLRQLVGLETADLEAARSQLYDERADANKTVKALQVQADSTPVYADAPAEEVSISALAHELELVEQAQQAAARLAQLAAATREEAARLGERRLAAYNEAIAIRRRLADLEVAINEYDVGLDKLESVASTQEFDAGVAQPSLEETAAIRARLTAAQAINDQVRVNRQHAQALEALAGAQVDARALTDRIAGLDAQMEARLAAAPFPVSGLGIDAEGVTWQGLPFDHASTSDRIRVSVAIGLAMNPTLRVLLVRDGSLLGSEKLALLAEMAAAAGAQVWLEMLQDAPDARTTVFIEEGVLA